MDLDMFKDVPFLLMSAGKYIPSFTVESQPLLQVTILSILPIFLFQIILTSIHFQASSSPSGASTSASTSS